VSGNQVTSQVHERACLEAEEVGRDLAIPAIGKAPWGTHFCQFYDSKQDLLDTLVPFFRAGLENNEMCQWMTSDPLTVEDAVEALSREVDDLERRVARGQMLIGPISFWYITSEEVDPERLLNLWTPAIENALTQRYAGLRVTGNESWLPARQWKQFMVYESTFGQKYLNQRVVALCTYPLGMCDSSKMLDVLIRHQFALIKHRGWTLIEPSERKRATAAVERMNQALAERTAELQAALADLRGFSRWVTHDLRAPLRSVRGFSDLLAETLVPRMQDDERHLFERIQASEDRMDTLITDILADTTAQQDALHPRPVDLEALVRETWETLADAMTAGRATCRSNNCPGPMVTRPCSSRCWPTCSTTRSSSPARSPPLTSRSAPAPSTGKTSTTCATTAKASTPTVPTRCSARSNACTARASTRAPASA
jgi:signal transduction histidine kinase